MKLVFPLAIASFIFVLNVSSQPQTQPQTAQSQTIAAGLQPGHFQADVSGTLQIHLQGEALLKRSPQGDWSITMAAKEKPDSPPRTVILVFPGKIKPGSYEIRPYERAFSENGKVEFVGGTFNSYEIQGVNGAGKLELTKAGPTYSGTFEISVESYDHQAKASVKGSFYELEEQKEKAPEEKKKE
jgi:hypothetical protein